MYKIKVTLSGTVASIQERTDLVYINDSQEVAFVKEFLAGKNKECQQELEDFNAFFVKVGDGNYIEVFAITSNIPWLNQPLYKVELVKID